MDYGPRVVNTAQCHEDSSFWKALRSECMCQVVVVLLPRRILVVKLSYHSGSNIDQSDHMVEHARTQPIGFLSWKSHGPHFHTKDQGHLRRCREGNAMLQGSLYPEWHNASYLSVDRKKVSLQELTHPSDWFCSQPHREVRGGPTNELGEVPREPVGIGLQGSTRSGI
jgi:hypothetical protein